MSSKKNTIYNNSLGKFIQHNHGARKADKKKFHIRLQAVQEEPPKEADRVSGVKIFWLLFHRMEKVTGKTLFRKEKTSSDFWGTRLRQAGRRLTTVFQHLTPNPSPEREGRITTNVFPSPSPCEEEFRVRLRKYLSFFHLTTYRLTTLLALGSWLLVLNTYSQQLAPLSNEYNRRIEFDMARSGTPFFTVLKPYYDTQYYSLDTLASFKSKAKPGDSWLKRKLFNESFIQVDSPDFHLYADPVFEFGLGKDNAGNNTYANIRGFRVGGRLGKNFAFGTDLYESEVAFNSLIRKEMKGKVIVPGQGRIHNVGTRWDFSNSSGYLSFSNHNLNFQLGYGKNFIGDGYNSLLLSDVSYNYPYLKTTWSNKNLLYSWMLFCTQDPVLKIRTNLEPFQTRIASVHILSLNISPKLQASFIHTELFNSPDSLGRITGILKILNPLPFPEKDQMTNSLWGINFKFLIRRNLWLYNQWAFDNVFKGKLRKAVQLGFKHFDVFSLRGLFLQAEYNYIEPYFYTSENKALQWLNYSEPLAHPYGNNISERLIELSYKFKRWQIDGQLSFDSQLESNANLSGLKFYRLPYLENESKIFHSNIQLNFYLNTRTLSHFSIGYIYHEEKAITPFTMKYIFFSFRTMLKNFYVNN